MAKRIPDRSVDLPGSLAFPGPLDAEAPRPSAAEPRVNKSEEIRVEAQRLLDRGEKPTPKAIIQALQARGIAIVSPQASQVLKRMGIEGRPRRKKGQAAERGQRPLPRERDERPSRAPLTDTEAADDRPSGSGRRAAGDDAFTLHDLIAAKQFAAMAGGPRRAMRLLEALEKLV